MMDMSSKIRRISATVAVAVAFSAFLAACGSSPTNPSAAAPAPIQAPSAIAKTGTLLIGSGLEYPPMEFFNNQHQPAGVDVKLGEAIAKSMGLKTQFVQIAFAGLIPALNANRIDMIMADMNITPQRSQVVDFVPYLSDGSSIVVAAGNPKHITNLADLSGKTVAVQLGTTLQAAADAENQKLQAAGKAPISVLTFQQATDAMNELVIGRVQAVLLTTSISKYYAKQHPSEFYVVPKPFASEPVGIAINKHDPALVKAVTKAVQLLKKNGTFQKILNQYFGK